MGRYVNPGNEGFSSILRGKYVDKTGLHMSVPVLLVGVTYDAKTKEHSCQIEPL